MLMVHPGIYSKAFAQGSSHAAKWKVVSVRQDRLYIYVSAWWLSSVVRYAQAMHSCDCLLDMHLHGCMQLAKQSQY